MYDNVIAVIMKHSDDYTNPYSKWAMEELAYRLRFESMRLPSHISGHVMLEPMEVAREFRDGLHHYYSISKNSKTRSIFFTAKEAVQDIICLFERRKHE